MNNRKAMAALALTAAIGLLSTGCGSKTAPPAAAASSVTPAPDLTTASTDPTTSDMAATPAATSASAVPPPVPAATETTTVALTTTTTAAPPPPPPAPAPAPGGLAVDCRILKPIASGAIGQLMPIETMGPAQGQAARAAYVAQLRSAQGGLTSPQGRSDLAGLINSVQNAKTIADGQQVLGSINQIQGDCP